CLQIESLVSADGAAPPEDLLARLSAAQAAWRQAGDAPRDAVAPLLARFGAARDRIVEAWPHAFLGTDLDPEANRRNLEKLCRGAEGGRRWPGAARAACSSRRPGPPPSAIWPRVSRTRWPRTRWGDGPPWTRAGTRPRPRWRRRRRPGSAWDRCRAPRGSRSPS